MIPASALQKLRPAAADKALPFLNDVLQAAADAIFSIHITGTAITGDYHEKFSDVNSIFVLKKMDIGFLDILSDLGKKYRRDKIAAPLIMTPEYIRTSLDVFPVEFLNFRMLHATVFGDDLLSGIEISREHLRHQCERELKVKLISLRQGYLSALGDRKALAEGIVRSITGYIPLFRSILFLLGESPPVLQMDVMRSFSRTEHISTDIFMKILRMRHERTSPSKDDIHRIFEDYYRATEELGRIIDEIRE